MTNRGLIQAALQMLGVVDAHETASAEDAALGLSEMNDLMADLDADGVDLGYVTQDSVNAEFPLGDSDAAQIKPLLAMRLHTFYPAQKIPESLPIRAGKAEARLYRDAVLENMEEASMTNLPLGEATGGQGNILTGD
jgi:hypothetical protein